MKFVFLLDECMKFLIEFENTCLNA